MTNLIEICTDCQTNFRVVKKGVTVFERLDSGILYKIWLADRMVCLGCNKVIISRFADNPVHCLGAGTGEIEATAEALAANPEFEVFDWYPTSRNPVDQTVPVDTVELAANVEDIE